MRKWGLLITFFYALIITFLLIPAFPYFTTSFDGWHGVFQHARDAYAEWALWVAIAVPIFGEMLLLFLRVDTSQKRLRPRAHIAISAVTAGLFLAVLTASAIVDVNVGIRGEKAIFWNLVDKHELMVLVAFPVALWLAWAVVFYRFSRDSADPVTRAVSWLFRGSVLELLIAIPAHVMVRRRNECSAPVVTSFGIASGITIMLLSFGPSVLLLYKKRIESLQARRAAAAK